jgi:quercetin dioxygenase-like cupin family protein
MRSTRGIIVAIVAVFAGSGVAVAGHVMQVDPATVPTGFLAVHNEIGDVPVSALARAAASGGADVFVQHVRLGSKSATGWHTHPGPALVSVVKGSLTYEYAASNRCHAIEYQAGRGFVDRGFGHVHRAIAGNEGVDFYVTYVLPPGSETHVIGTGAPEECVS